MSQIKANKLKEAQKTLSQFGNVANELPTMVDEKDAGYYHFVFVTPLSNKAGTRMDYKWHTAKVDKKSFDANSKTDKETLGGLYKIYAIYHDPTIGEAAVISAAQLQKRMDEARTKNMTPAEQLTQSLGMLGQVEALKKELEEMKKAQEPKK